MKFNLKLKIKTAVFCILITLLAAVSLYAKAPARGPIQPAIGPGGSTYLHESITHWGKGAKHEKYEVFEPDKPSVKKAGLVILIHDRMYPDPNFYMGHIRHLCRRGWVVVFPKYQGTDQFEKHYMFNIIRSIKDYLLEAFAQQKIDIDRDKIAIIGSGCGAVLAVNVAATADYFGLPIPKAIMAIMPESGYFKLLDLTGISREARLIVVNGDRIEAEGAKLSTDIFYGADRVSLKNKVHVYVTSDFYGQPPLIANRFSALSLEEDLYERYIVENRNTFLIAYKDKEIAHYTRGDWIDAFDWFVSYRLFDLLLEFTFDKQTDLTFFKKNNEVKKMGYWSNGRPLKHLIFTDRP